MAGQNGAYCFKYVSIWTANFDAAFGQRLRLPKNATAFFGLRDKMIAKIFSGAVLGIDAYIVEVEVDTAFGLPVFSTVGLPDNAVKESKDRVRAALKNSGYEFPAKHITVNLAPADIKKEGTTFDLPVSLGILSAEGIVKKER